MPNSPKPTFTFPLPLVAAVDRVPDRQDVTAMIEALLDVLERHQAGPNEGVLALLTSFVQGASRILELSSGADAEHNRQSLLAMLEHARRTIDTCSAAAPPSGLIHCCTTASVDCPCCSGAGAKACLAELVQHPGFITCVEFPGLLGPAAQSPARPRSGHGEPCRTVAPDGVSLVG